MGSKLRQPSRAAHETGRIAISQPMVNATANLRPESERQTQHLVSHLFPVPFRPADQEIFHVKGLPEIRVCLRFNLGQRGLGSKSASGLASGFASEISGNRLRERVENRLRKRDFASDPLPLTACLRKRLAPESNVDNRRPFRALVRRLGLGVRG